MDWNPPEGSLKPEPFERQGVVYAIAEFKDDADVRRILRDVAMDGWVRVAMTREPLMHMAHHALGQSGEFIILREATSGEPICIGEYHVSNLFLNGVPEVVPYIGALRVVPRWRNRISILRRGLDVVRRLQAMRGEPAFMLTSIAAENERAVRLLSANLAGMPDYHFVGRLVTLVLPVSRGAPCSRLLGTDMKDIPRLAAALCAQGKRTQFMPVWDEAQLCRVITEGGLGPGDFRIMVSDGEVIGMLAAWDQRQFRQVKVTGYVPWLSGLRPAYNIFARLGRRPLLTPEGSTLRQVSLSHFICPADLTDAIDLVSGVLDLAQAKGAETALLGLSADHPLLRDLKRRFNALSYETYIYLVSWKSGPPPPLLDNSRMLSPEIAVL